MKTKLVLGLTLATLLLAPSWPEPPLRTGAYVQDVTRTSAKICWVGDRGDGVALVVTARGGGGAPSVAWQERGERTVALVTGLLPATEYEFVANEGERRHTDLSGTFKTPPATSDARVRFAVLGDSGGLPLWVNLSRAPIVHALASVDALPAAGHVSTIGAMLADAKPEFWLHTGDVIYPRGEQRHYRPGFFLPFAEALRHAPVYPVIGNHDWEWTDGRPLLANFELPDVGDEQFFTFAWGPVRVVGLNLNRSVGLDPGLAFLDRVLAAADEPWRIVVEHFPPWSASDQRDRPDLIERLVPALVAAKVDVLFCGHDHTYQRYRAEGPLHVVVTGGGGKSLYELREHPRLVVAKSAYHLCTVDCGPKQFSLRAVGLDGSEIDSFSIEK
ncbi:MAG: metallophosphoesterase [Planctomycetota bacterium]